MKASRAVLAAVIITVCMILTTGAPATAGSVLTVDLTSGRQHVKVGTVEAELEGSILTVTYRADPGWKIYLTHMDVAASPGDLPQNKNGNPTPGRFTYKKGHKPAVEQYSYAVDIVGEGLDGAAEIFIAAHAGLFNEVDPAKKKSAWAGGLEFPGKNWATYFVYTRSLNEPPVATDDEVTVNEDITVAFNILMNDYDPDADPLLVTGNTDPSHGILAAHPNGNCTYSPDMNYNGYDDFTYYVSDGHAPPVAGTVHITVNPVNDAPEGIMLSNNTVMEDSPGAVIGTLWVLDADIGDVHMLTVVAGPRFEIMGNVLKLQDTESLDYDVEPTVQILVRAIDSGLFMCTEVFTIVVIEAPAH